MLVGLQLGVLVSTGISKWVCSSVQVGLVVSASQVIVGLVCGMCRHKAVLTAMEVVLAPRALLRAGLQNIGSIT